MVTGSHFAVIPYQLLYINVLIVENIASEVPRTKNVYLYFEKYTKNEYQPASVGVGYFKKSKANEKVRSVSYFKEIGKDSFVRALNKYVLLRLRV